MEKIKKSQGKKKELPSRILNSEGKQVQGGQIMDVWKDSFQGMFSEKKMNSFDKNFESFIKKEVQRIEVEVKMKVGDTR